MEITIMPIGIQDNSIGLEHYCYPVAANAFNQIYNDLIDHLIDADEHTDEPIIINVCLDTFTRAIWQNIYSVKRYSPRIAIRVYRLGNELSILACRTQEGHSVILSDRKNAQTMLDNADEIYTLFPGDDSIDVDYWDNKHQNFERAMLRNASIAYLFTDSFDCFEEVEAETIQRAPNASYRVVCGLEEMRMHEF